MKEFLKKSKNKKKRSENQETKAARQGYYLNKKVIMVKLKFEA